MEDMIFELLQVQKMQNDLGLLVSCNDKTEDFGLMLSEGDAAELIECRNESLRRYRRVEFGSGILEKLVYAFCDSQYLEQDNYVETLEQLQDIFYEFKNESEDRLTDDELLSFMREQFEEVCFGDVGYLEDTCLERFSRAVRAGYTGYRASGGSGEYARLSEEQRWDKELYLSVLHELCWD